MAKRRASNGRSLAATPHQTANVPRGAKRTTIGRPKALAAGSTATSPAKSQPAAKRQASKQKPTPRIPLRQYITQKIYAAIGMLGTAGGTLAAGWSTTELFRSVAESPHPWGSGFIGVVMGGVTLAGAFMTSVFAYALVDTSVKVAKSSDVAPATAP